MGTKMKRLLFTSAAASLLALPQVVAAQSSAPAGNNPLNSGIYIEGALGVNAADEIEFDGGDGIVDSSIDPNTGFLGSLHLGYNLPQGALNIRVEGELAARANEVDEIEQDGLANIELENADVTSLAFMLNGLLDYYITPNLALSAGAGVGAANVAFDLAVLDDDDTGLAYQGRLGARYSFSGNSTVSLAYTYFATSELEVETEIGVDLEFDYASHGFTLGYAYHF